MLGATRPRWLYWALFSVNAFLLLAGAGTALVLHGLRAEHVREDQQIWKTITDRCGDVVDRTIRPTVERKRLDARTIQHRYRVERKDGRTAVVTYEGDGGLFISLRRVDCGAQ